MLLSYSSKVLRLARRHSTLSPHSLPLLASLANQAVSSGGNFLLGIYLARSMSLAHFGTYGMAYGICMLFVGVGNALILTQMAVDLAEQAPEQRDAHASRMLAGVLALGGALLAITALAALLLTVLAPDAADVLLALPALALAACALLCTEFFVMYAYQRRQVLLALAVNAVTMLVLGGGLLLAQRAGVALTATLVLLLYALGAALGSLLAFWVTPLTVRLPRAALLAAWRALWGHGRWALAGVGVTWAQAQSYTYIVALLLGPAGVGLANLARLFVSPFSFLLPAINKMALPRLADMQASNPARMRQLAVLLTLTQSAMVMLYAVLLWTCFDAVALLLLGRAVDGLGPLAALWCLITLCQVVRSGGAVQLQMQRAFRRLALLNIPSAALSLVGAALLVVPFNQSGALAAMLAGELLLATLIWKELRHAKPTP